MKKRIWSFVLVVMMALTMLPTTIFATETEMSETFQQILTDGKLVVPAVRPTSEVEEYCFVSWYLSRFYTDEYEFYVASDENYDECEVILSYFDENISLETHVLQVEWAEDNENIKNKLKVYADQITYQDGEAGIDGDTFLVKDLEVINYWAIGHDETNSSLDTMINYSGEFKEFLGNSNISVSFNTCTGMGADEELLTFALCDSVFIYNGIGYLRTNGFGARVEHIIYVPDETENTKEALMTAAQTRINEYLKDDTLVSITYGGAFTDIVDYEYYQEVLGVSDVEHYFVAEMDGMERKFLIIRDSSKMVIPSYASADVNTNVSVSTTDSSVPLDTMVSVDKLTSGTEYEKIISLLDVEANETYDINLYSDSLKDNVTKLENGTFEVKIPISEELASKTLVAYYVDENDQIVEYDVTVKDGYASFTTDHFSIYTIAEAKTTQSEPSYEIVTPTDNAGSGKITNTVDDLKLKVSFTTEEQALIDAGADVKFTLDVTDIANTISDTEKTLIESKLDSQKVGMYLNIDFTKQIGTSEAVKITELKDDIKIQITLPDTLINEDVNYNRIYSVLRVHDDKVDVLETEFDANTKFLTIETDHFSTYVIVYKDVPVAQAPPATTPTTPTSPNTGDNAMNMCMTLFVLSGIGVVVYKRKNLAK